MLKAKKKTPKIVIYAEEIRLVGPCPAQGMHLQTAMNLVPFAFILPLVFSLSAFSGGMDLSVLASEFKKIQVHPKTIEIPSGTNLLSDPSQALEADIQKMLPEAYSRLNFIPARQNQSQLLNLFQNLFLHLRLLH